MPALPFICLRCYRVFKIVEVSRPVRIGESASGFCTEHLAEMEMELHGPMHITIEKRWCPCGREILTVKKLCEFCQVEEMAHV